MNEAEEKLREALKSLSSKVSQWRGKGLSEADTKRTLIEPLLAALGWDIHDPGEVRSEYSTAGGRVDYALMVNGKMMLFVEAKALGAVAERDAAQLVGYAATEGVRWGVVTDGATYELYDNFNTGPLEDKIVFRCAIGEFLEETAQERCAEVPRRLSVISKGTITEGRAGSLASQILAEERRRREETVLGGRMAAVGSGDLQDEEEVWAVVRASFRHLEALYDLLRSKIAERIPHLRAELASGGEGWIKFKNARPPSQRRGQYSHFLLTLQKRRVRIEVWFDDNRYAPSKEAVEAKGLESAMHRASAKGFYITGLEQIDDEVVDWLERAQ